MNSMNSPDKMLACNTSASVSGVASLQTCDSRPTSASKTDDQNIM